MFTDMGESSTACLSEHQNLFTAAAFSDQFGTSKVKAAKSFSFVLHTVIYTKQNLLLVHS